MMYAILPLASLLLLGSFGALAVYESGRPARFFADRRTHLDGFVDRVTFIIQHVDFASYIRDEVKRLAKRVSHDIVHFTLQATRSVERLLTRVMKHLRSRDPMLSATRESARPFIESLSTFKEQLAATRPPEIGEQLG
jgi:hypothetical protein